ncbi:hypothetical protein ACS0TY_036470 [Phlomoides rotata]
MFSSHFLLLKKGLTSLKSGLYLLRNLPSGALLEFQLSLIFHFPPLKTLTVDVFLAFPTLEERFNITEIWVVFTPKSPVRSAARVPDLVSFDVN